VRGSAPGRLDLLGGVADYSGALVLETPTRRGIEVVARPADAFAVGPVTVAPTELAALAALTYADLRPALYAFPRWTHYVLGVALVLVRHGVIGPPRVRLEISSDLPRSVGVASSAALEVATARALGAGALDPLHLAALCQEAENRVVGAPCGIMDQVAVSLAAPGTVLPILCRPASTADPVAVPPGVQILGWPTGAAHDVGGRAYERARTAAFMGKRMVEVAAGRAWSCVSELPRAAVEELPERIDGAGFRRVWGSTGDDVTTVRPGETYPVRASTLFGIEEHGRAVEAMAALADGRPDRLGPLMAASQAGYDAMGLGHPAATRIIHEVLARPGVHGARSSGGGCGGTVVVVCEDGALDDREGLIR
jgi:galactokinase